MRMDLPPAKATLAASMACWNAVSIMAGAPVRIRSTATLQRPRALTSAAMLRSMSSRRPITSGSSSRIWNSISALPGLILARPAGKTYVAQGLPHGPVAVAVPCGVDVRLGHAADVRPAAKETAEMSFLIAPCRDFDGAVCVRIRIDDAGGFERIHNAKRPIEP